MKMKHYLWMLQLLPLLTVLVAWPATSATLRADLTRADSGRGFTRRELLRRMVIRSRARAAKLCPSGRPVTAPVVPVADAIGSNEYLIHFHIGTPRPQHVALEVDTGSDLIWTQCRPCLQCFPQTLPTLDTSTSSTVHGVACSDPLCQNVPILGCFIRGCIYQYKYGDKSMTIGQLARDSFTFHGKDGTGTVVSVPDLAFGCGMYTTGNFFPNESGIAGFGRGPLSLPSQLKVGKFSYCFTTLFEEPTSSSPVFLGAPDDLKAHATGPILSTPFVRNPPVRPSNYYLSLKGVTVGKTRLPIPESAFALKANGSGGTIIDSGTAITTFPRAMFSHLRSAFLAQVPLPSDKAGILQCCFSTASVPDVSKVPVPKLILHLEGADWELPRENYMVMVGDDDSGLLCLVIAAAGDQDSTIIGNFQQQNMHMVYDLAGNKLVIVPAQCDNM